MSWHWQQAYSVVAAAMRAYVLCLKPPGKTADPESVRQTPNVNLQQQQPRQSSNAGRQSVKDLAQQPTMSMFRLTGS